MTDPQDELGARFDERRPDENEDTGKEDTDETNNTDTPDGTNKTDNSDNTSNTNNVNNTPGPDRDENATRHKRQVPMYLTDEKADRINALYDRLDGLSKVEGDGGIEKHADFMEALVEFAVDNEDELADRLGITTD